MPRTHPLENHPAFRAVIEAAPHLAELGLALRDGELVSQLATACGDLAEGFAAEKNSVRRLSAHRRAYGTVRDLERKVIAIGRQKLAAANVVKRAQRAIDRADVMVGALLPT
jgi:hypothetical protein